jgi:hypothetical protein
MITFNTFTPDLFEDIICYLELKDVSQLLLTCHYFRDHFTIHLEVIKQTANFTIYKNQYLLKHVYKHYPNYLLNWSECDTNAIFSVVNNVIVAKKTGNLDTFKKKFHDKVIIFKNCDQLKGLLDFVDLDLSAVFQYFIDKSADQNETMILAAAKGYANIVMLLLNDIRIVFTSAVFDISILFSCSYGHTEVVKVLMGDSRIDPSVWNNAPFREAKRNDHHDILNMLLLDPRVDSTVL